MSKIYIEDNPNIHKSRSYLILSVIFAIPLLLYFFVFAVYKVHLPGIGHLLPMIILENRWIKMKSEI